MSSTPLFSMFRALRFTSSGLLRTSSRAFSTSGPSSVSPIPTTDSPPTTPNPGVIHLTPRALSRLSELRAKMPGVSDVRLRVRVDGGGCSGYKYEFQVGSEPLEEGDKVFGEGGCFAVVDPVSLDLLNGALVDWEESLMRSAFVIAANPNAEASCGCKSSFSVKGSTA